MISSFLASSLRAFAAVTVPFVRTAVQLRLLGRHAAHADHPGRAGGRALDVAADAGRALAVEDALSGHRAKRPDQLRHLLGEPGAEALLLLARLVVAERRAALADREARRLGALHVDVGGGRVAGLVQRHRAGLLGDVLGADRRARLDGRHRLDDVGPAERHPARRGGRSSAPSSRPARSSPASSRSSPAPARRGASRCRGPHRGRPWRGRGRRCRAGRASSACGTRRGGPSGRGASVPGRACPSGHWSRR